MARLDSYRLRVCKDALPTPHTYVEKGSETERKMERAWGTLSD